MSKKGAIGLSINTLVIIIISMVILGGGISLLYKFIGGAEDIKDKLDSRTDQELERLLIDQGKKVALPLHTATVEAGESHVFGIGILNIADTADFSIDIELKRVVDEDNLEISNLVDKDEVYTNWLIYDAGPHKIAENEHKKESILVQVPEDAPKGQYIFKASVSSGTPYGNPQLFYVTVR